MKKIGNLDLWFFMLFMALQPVFDAATFWTVNKMGLPNYIIYVRIALVLVLALVAMIRIGWKPLPISILVVYAVYIAANYFYNNHNGGDITTLEDTSKLFIMPITLLLIIWCGKIDTAAVVKRFWRGTAYGCIIIMAIVLTSLLTGTHYPTYDKPWLYLGLNGWFYSGNGQSIILVAATAFLLAMTLVRPNFLMPLAVAATWILLFFNATRFAYMGLILILVSLVVIMGLCHYVFKTMKFRWWMFATVIVALLLSVGLYPVSYVKKVYSFKDYQVEFFIDKAAQATPMPVIVAPAATPTTADSIAKDNTLAQYYQMLSTSSMKLQLDTRFKQLEFTKMSMRNAPIGRWLWGYGMQWLTTNVGDIETDYVAVLGGYGLIGTFLFFSPIIWALISSIITIWRKRKDGSLSLAVGVLLMVIALLLGAVQYAGRALQQPSVSIYFSLSVALLYLVTKYDLYKILPESLIPSREK